MFVFLSHFRSFPALDLDFKVCISANQWKSRYFSIDSPSYETSRSQPLALVDIPEPKLLDTVAALACNRLTLIREKDLDEASLLVRHSIYSNCRPTIFTCNAVLATLLRQSRYSDLLSLHRFITQASV